MCLNEGQIYALLIKKNLTPKKCRFIVRVYLILLEIRR